MLKGSIRSRNSEIFVFLRAFVDFGGGSFYNESIKLQIARSARKGHTMGFLDKLAGKAKGVLDGGVADKVMDALDDNLDDVVAKIPADKRDDVLKLLQSGKVDAAVDKVCEVAKVDKAEAEELVEKLKKLLK